MMNREDDNVTKAYMSSIVKEDIDAEFEALAEKGYTKDSNGAYFKALNEEESDMFYIQVELVKGGDGKASFVNAYLLYDDEPLVSTTERTVDMAIVTLKEIIDEFGRQFVEAQDNLEKMLNN